MIPFHCSSFRRNQLYSFHLLSFLPCQIIIFKHTEKRSQEEYSQYFWIVTSIILYQVGCNSSFVDDRMGRHQQEVIKLC